MSEQEVSVAAAHAADVEYLVRKSISSGYSLFSCLTPPAYLAYTLSRHGRASLSVKRILRATWLGGAGGSLAGGVFGYVRYSFSNDEQLRKHRLRIAYDTSRLRAEDHSTIGAVLCGVVVPAMLWRRAPAYDLILGGAGIGNSIGLLWHHTRSLTGDTPPKAIVPN